MKDIKGYEGLYAVTSCGKVWSYKRKKWISQFLDHKGYPKVRLFKDGVHRNFKVSRLVLETYSPIDGMEKLQANHIDEVKNHNWLGNLNWMTNKENNNWGTKNKRANETKRARGLLR